MLDVAAGGQSRIQAWLHSTSATGKIHSGKRREQDMEWRDAADVAQHQTLPVDG